MNKLEEILNKLSIRQSILRHSYLSMEKLSRLEKIKSYYDKEQLSNMEEKVIFKIDYAEQLSSDFKLPLKVRGIFLKEGRPKKKYYTKEQMKLSVENSLNSSFPFCLDHKDAEVGKIVGKVDRIEYDDTIDVLRFYGHINSELYARNILDGVIKEVSATIYSDSEYTSEYGLVATDLIFKELSLVWEGSVKGNTLEAY